MCYNHKASGLLSHNDRNINNATKIKPNTTPEETQPETIHSAETLEQCISYAALCISLKAWRMT